ncbi:MAG: UDP-N-acetylmuramate--L-alanine ligase [Lachnospiraceae bacterium]
MYQINFSNPVHIHFIGIGGISMSGLAKLLKSRGFTVSGSDWNRSALTEELTALGIPVMLGQRRANITPDIDLVVYTAAVAADNEELTAAREAGIPTMVRADLLGQIMKHYPHAVGIAGTHGKTTTTSLLSMLLLNGGLDPTIHVGGVLDAIGGNLRIGHSEYFVAEACEYTNTFLSLAPTDAIILNIEEDHLDFFKDINDIRASFAKYIALVPAGGTVCINAEIDRYDTLFEGAACEMETYGILDDTVNTANASSPYDYAAANLTYDHSGCGSYDLIVHGKYICRIVLGIPGRHNISNSLPAIALALKYGVEIESIRTTLAAFHGTRRRFEYKGSLGGIRIYDDYAHHPTEIRATLTAAQAFEHKRIITVFQPHTYTRTKALLPEFAEALSLSDVIVLADIYASREKDTDGKVSSADLEAKLLEKGKEVYYFHSFDEIENFLLQFSSDGDLLITMGAGDIVIVGESLLGK